MKISFKLQYKYVGTVSSFDDFLLFIINTQYEFQRKI